MLQLCATSQCISTFIVWKASIWNSEKMQKRVKNLAVLDIITNCTSSFLRNFAHMQHAVNTEYLRGFFTSQVLIYYAEIRYTRIYFPSRFKAIQSLIVLRYLWIITQYSASVQFTSGDRKSLQWISHLAPILVCSLSEASATEADISYARKIVRYLIYIQWFISFSGIHLKQKFYFCSNLILQYDSYYYSWLRIHIFANKLTDYAKAFELHR